MENKQFSIFFYLFFIFLFFKNSKIWKIALFLNSQNLTNYDQENVIEKEKYCNGNSSYANWVWGCVKSTAYGAVRVTILTRYIPSVRLSGNPARKSQ